MGLGGRLLSAMLSMLYRKLKIMTTKIPMAFSNVVGVLNMMVLKQISITWSFDV